MLEIYEQEFLSVVSAYFQDKEEFTVSKNNLEKILALANEHNILPLVCDVLSKKYGSEKAFLAKKPLAFAAFSSQCVRTERFLAIYRSLIENGIEPVCVKGITLRSLYKNGSLRPSGDEDLLVKKEDEAAFARVMKVNLLELRKEGKNEKTFFETSTSLMIEAHTELFAESGEFGKRLDELFSSVLDDLKITEIENTPVLTLGVQSGLLYLVCHAFKHFVRSGFGIRQVCDIAVYIREYKDAIDFSLLENELSKIHAKVFFEALVNIAIRHLGFEDIAFSLPDTSIDELPLLEDILCAGVYGKSNASRLHSATITLSAVSGQKKKATVFSALFPSRKSLAETYPSLSRFRFLYLWFVFLRIVKYVCSLLFKKGKDGNAKESVKIAKERTEIFKKYKIITSQTSSAAKKGESV